MLINSKFLFIKIKGVALKALLSSSKTKLLIQILLVFICLPLNSQVSLPPLFDTTEKKLEYLLWVENNIPQLFQEGAEYDIDLFNLISEQNKLTRHLKKSTTYLKESKKAGKRFNLTISEFTNDFTNIFTLSENTISNIVTYYDKMESVDINTIVPELEAEFSKLQKINTQSVLTGILMTLDFHAKEKFLQIDSFDAQIDFLKSDTNLPHENIEDKFKFKFLKDWDENKEKNKDNLIDYLTKKMELEKGFLLQFISVLLVHEGINVKKLKKEPLSKKINELLEKKIEIITKITNFTSEKNKKNINKLASSLIKKYETSEKIEQQKLKSRIHLVEIPPYLGVFRGFCGGDCATQLSFPYVYATNERTFIINDENDSMLGYMQGTEVEIDGELTFYLHDISGPRLSQSSVELILKGFYKNLEKIGYEFFAIPNGKKIHDNINYKNIRGYLQKIAKLHHDKYETDHTVYLDNHSRKLVNKPPAKPEA